MSADRRVLVIAAAAMVGLVLVGVVSAQIFTTSACGGIEPQRVEDRIAGQDVAAVLDRALPDLDEDERRATQGAIDALTAHLGPLTGIADVGGAQRLVPVTDGIVAVGPTTTVLAPEQGAVRATADVADGTVVGSGSMLYSVALENPLTGQVDALAPLGLDLTAGTCVDTATVGTPFAFLLDADDGEMLLFRVEDDADDPEVELRHVDGRRWGADLAVGTAPPGTLAERLSGRLGDELAVVARRVAGGDGDLAVVAFERGDGGTRWTVAVEAHAGEAPDGDEPVRPEAISITADVVVLAVRRDADHAEAATFVGLDADMGTIAWTVDLPGPREPLAVARDGDTLLLAVREDDGVTAYEVELATGAAHPRTAVPGDRAEVAVVDDGFVLAMSSGLQVVTEDSVDTIATGAAVADIVTTDAGVAILLRTTEGAVAVGFAG